ncbi:MAG: TetR family transcriptional regulator [Mycobacterium sp.]
MFDFDAMVDDVLMTSSTRPSRLRDRTRQTLLGAAIEVLGKHPGASMADIAAAAGVARSTLHRYFPDRSSLMDGIESHVEAEYEEALQHARPHEGTGLAAYSRIVDELLERLDSLAWWMRTEYEEVADFDCEADRGIVAVVARGQDDSSIDTQFSAQWVVAMTWALLAEAHQQTGNEQLSRREIRDMCRNALLKVAAGPSPQ